MQSSNQGIVICVGIGEGIMTCCLTWALGHCDVCMIMIVCYGESGIDMGITIL